METNSLKKVLVCGGRDFNDIEMMEGVLGYAYLNHYLDFIIEGGATGADTLARNWAIKWNIPYKTFKADWKMHGNAAGPIRNKQMLDEGKPCLVIAFPGGKGTANMIAQALKAGIQVRIVHD